MSNYYDLISAFLILALNKFIKLRSNKLFTEEINLIE